MVNFTQTATNIFYSTSGYPIAWASIWEVENWNAAGPSVPSMGEILRMAYDGGARTLLIDGVSVRVTASAGGITVSPTLLNGPTNALNAFLETQLTQRPTDRLAWHADGFPLTLSEALGLPIIAVVYTAGYAATDDMTLTMWGRFA
jgi:hypothetical protein